MIHEIFPHQFNNQYQPKKNISNNDYILYFKENSLLLKSNGDDLEIPQKKDFPEITEKTDATFLFTLNDYSCFLIWDNVKNGNPNINFHDIWIFRTMRLQEMAWISLVGFHLMNWYSKNKYCGTCGKLTQHKHDERALVCSNCQTTIYPSISPAIIVAVISNDKILLARGSKNPNGWYSLLAGYTDIGESLEETVVREVKEEVGLDVKNIRYYKSQPWPLSSSMMVGFIAEADENQPLRIDENEIAEAAWFSSGNLPPFSPNLSISGELIEKFNKGEF